jgi:hypothetical protein
MKSLFLLSILLFASCNNRETKNVPDLVLKFSKNHLIHLMKEGTEKTLVVVLNPSECGSCEAEVTSFVNSIYPNFKSITVVPKDIKVSSDIKKSKTISMVRKELDQHGLLNANGSILVFEGKKCIYFSPIDILNTTKMKDTIIGLGN